MTTIKDCTSIDLDKHGLIEASAGTGKTYTIEHLVVRIIVEKNISIENILLVTFTEKATGELKTRIRQTIEDELSSSKNSPESHKRLHNSLLNFDSASIYTIHGFCQSILRDFSFEQKQLFDFDVVNDDYIYEKMLHEQMRGSWIKEYGDKLPDLLKIAGFPDVNKMRGESQWVARVIEIARHYNPNIGHRLEPEVDDSLDSDKITDKIAKHFQEMLNMVGHVDGDNIENSAFYASYGKLNFNVRTKGTNQKKIITPLLEMLYQYSKDNSVCLIDVCLLFNKLSEEHKGYKEIGFHTLIPQKWNKNINNLDEECPCLQEIIDHLTAISVAVKAVSYMLAVQTIKQLRIDVAEFKKSRGLVSFDDLLLNVAHAVKNDNDGQLRKKLRDKFLYILVDEFQDTDSVQWEIFSKIFLEGEVQRLFLIGDPKQAIYSFRGADIYTYLDARNEYRNLALKGLAKIYSLGINWRSGPGLITSFNHLFKQDAWFGEHSDDADIIYNDVSASEDAVNGMEDEHGRAALTILKINADRGKEGLKHLAVLTANEINFLIENSKITEKGESRSLNFGDFCVLVRSRSEVQVIEMELDALNIPHTYYKKPGLYQSDEAFELVHLFRAIESSYDESSIKKALLTPFFDISIEGLRNYTVLLQSQTVVKLFQMWNSFIISRKWQKLFQSIIEDSGLLIRELSKVDGERKLTNYRHILQNLGELAFSKNLDFHGIVNCLESYSRKTVAAEYEMDLHKIESERSKVNIMTIHSSKGLEFSVVFLIGGFTSSNIEQYYKYKENGVTVFDLSKSSHGKLLHKQEQEAEDKRLYYVALTRAACRLYIPEFKPERVQNSGPVSTFIYDAIQSMNSEWRDDSRKDSLSFLDITDQNDSSREREHGNEPNIDITIPEKILPPEIFNFKNRMIKIESYSSLNRESETVTLPYSVDSLKPEYMAISSDKNDDENGNVVKEPLTYKSSTEHELPRGKDIGNMFHGVLENLDFENIRELKEQGMTCDSIANSDNDMSQLITKQMIYNNIPIENKTDVTKILWDTLTTTITAVDEDFMLINLKENEKICEMAFHFPLQSLDNRVLPDGIKHEKGYVTGFIDLVFCVGGRYFIVDWKSNYIAAGYDFDGMEHVMNKSNYHLQYRIYTKAIILWLKNCMGEDFDYEKNFGGVLYFFLRGMGSGNGYGIYFRKLDDIEML